MKLNIFNQTDLERMQMGLILSVNKGTPESCYLLQIEYSNSNSKTKSNNKEERPYVIIGKGVVFDSGGYNIKYGNFGNMKSDMTGSAYAYGLIRKLALNNINGRFIALLPIVENMLDGTATLPGDIITACNFKTVEIVDTDAEGRCIMADCLAYSKRFNPINCMDIATLTGQADHIFDGKSTVVMGYPHSFLEKYVKIGNTETCEHAWNLPMWKEYIDLTKSKIANYRNDCNECKASTIFAGAFLSNFVPPNVEKWIHCDIAGVAYKEGSELKYGSTGEGFDTMYKFILNSFRITSKLK